MSDDVRRSVLARAEAISALPANSSSADVEAFIQAAEEAGYPRAAVEQALREQALRHKADFAITPPAAGVLVFAKSANGKYYVAEVLSSDSESARVHFLRGSDSTLPLADLRPCEFLPGERIVCNWPSWARIRARSKAMMLRLSA